MPITRTVTLYEFDELSEEAQEAALCSLWDINVDHNWWDCTLADAHAIGLTIKEFDIDRKTIKGELHEYPLDVFKLIRENHGVRCDTLETATAYHKQYIEAFMQWHKQRLQVASLDELQQPEEVDTWSWKPKDWLKQFKWEDEAKEVEADFVKALLEDYLVMLRDEYEHLTSRVEVVESIKANGYLFNELGKIA
jgi:hypothetical protein